MFCASSIRRTIYYKLFGRNKAINKDLQDKKYEIQRGRDCKLKDYSLVLKKSFVSLRQCRIGCNNRNAKKKEKIELGY